MKKICICTTIASTLKSFVVETAKYLHNECGYDVTLICSPDEAFAKSLPEYLHFIPVDMPRGAKLSGFKSIKVFRKIFREQKFDLVQYSTPNAACYASIAAKKEKVPIRLYCQWGIRYVGLSGVSRKIFKIIEKLVCKNSTHIHAVSQKNMAFAIGEGLYKAKKASVVGNGGTIGVDMTQYDVNNKSEWRTATREQYGLSQSDFVYGFVGRISKDKGCEELLNAFFEVSRKHENARLLIVGPFENDCGIAADVLEKAKKNEKIVFTGRVDGADMKKYYSAIDVLVHPTYREGFGMVIQEAGAMAVPTITTNIPGASEVMEDGVSCLLVEPRSTEQLAEQMSEVILSDELIKALGAQAYERTKTLYNRPVMLEFQRKDYEKLLGGDKE
ncbi:MAG: glycosyltransferase family 4 protein [Clostridia bacterium]|nr:glycosyltransferase family 4 protein [Clostridia bacterium]